MPRAVVFTARFSRVLFLLGLLLGLCPLESLPAADDAREGEEAKKGSWDVANPPGPTAEVAIDTDEGTWMSVDVSPDGDEIAFDLLGDIYTVTLTGGARALTRGMPWDMQPRFSPDGKWIAFTSDRGGGDNIWVMGRDGSTPRAVTSERFRLLNSPAWSPDGQFIVARKHFTSRRSLGAGEIWLYHLNGGDDGVQLVARPNDQKDLGEPAFSPDGRFVYFSQDVTPGDVFEYNKDSNAGIYAIRRLDRETGDIERVTGGPGGAIRPTPSPDGEKLAFIRRVRFRSVLFVHDLRTGAERAVYDGLDRDMQETWAIHGVYPGMAWTPDGSSVVLWATGKIRRVEVASGEVHTVPFRIRDSRRVVETLRRKTEVCPEHFDVRMIRGVEVDPHGERVVFQALGHIYTRELEDDGEPERVTAQREHFEHDPSFSPDGASIVYTTWDDEELGRVRIVGASGGEGRVLTRDRGHYVDPVFSRDGHWVLYTKVAGGGLRSPLWSKDTGIYRVPAGGGESERILQSGSSPHFGAQAERFYFTGQQGGKRSLESIGLFGADPRTHALSENASEFRVSPDGKWLAFVERFGAFVVPLVAAGAPLEIGPEMNSLPLKRVSPDAGVNLHWSGDSRSLRWNLGPELFSHDTASAFAEPASNGESGSEAESVEPRKHAIGFRQPSDVPGGRIALVGGRIVTMRGDEIIPEGTIIVDANRIATVGESEKVRVPAGTTVVDLRGLTILPGLIDVHAHGARGSSGIIPEQNWRAFSELSFGVTTIHDPSNHTETIFAASEMARAGRIVSPRLFSTGTILYGAAGASKAEVESLDDARFHLRRMHAVGAFSVKSYNQPRRDQRQQILEAARELGMIVVPEGGSLYHMDMSMLVDGHTGIEHCLPVGAVYDDVLDLWSGIEAGYTPTTVVGFGGLSGEYYWYQTTRVWENERLLRFVPRPLIDARSRRRIMAPDEEFNHFNIAQICKKLTDRGVRVHLGAHGQREGLAAHWELWMLVQGGMTPLEAFRAATLNGAVYLGMEGDIGSIETGKLADLIALEGDPLKEIRDSERVKYTMINGRLFDAASMDEIGNHPRRRAKFYFERGEGAFDATSGSVCGCAAGTEGSP